jgi:hypothetical protein
MSVTGAIKSSNAAKEDGDGEKTSGSLGMVGFTDTPYPTQRPAEKNSDISSLEAVKGSLGNSGTNESAYTEQKFQISGMTGK